MSYIPTIQGTAVYTATGKRIIDEPKAVPVPIIDEKWLDARIKGKGFTDADVSRALFGNSAEIGSVRYTLRKGSLGEKWTHKLRKAFSAGYEKKVRDYYEKKETTRRSEMTVQDLERMLLERNVKAATLVKYSGMDLSETYISATIKNAKAKGGHISWRGESNIMEMFRIWDEGHAKPEEKAMPGELYKGEFYEEKQEDMENTATAIPGEVNKAEEREETAKVEKQNFYDALMGTRLIVHCRRRALTELNKEDTDELSFRKGLDAMADAIIAYLEMMEEER